MSVDVNVMQLALRARAKSLVVCTTGSATLAATSSGFTHASGSFVTDGFKPGMEVVGTGFSTANNAARTVTAVTATQLTCSGLAAQAAAGSRTLSVGLPSSGAWENTKFEPVQGVPWVEEQFTPNLTRRPGIVPDGWVEHRSLYSLHVYVPEGIGIGAANAYATALLAHFTPGLGITLSTGDVLRVRADTGVGLGQKLIRRPGFASQPVNIPLWLYTLQTIN